MQDIRFDFDTNANFRFCGVGFVSVMRNRGYVFEYKNGKMRDSFIWVAEGETEYHFGNGEKILKAEKNDFIFVPKEIPYRTVYCKDRTVIKIITFDPETKTSLPILANPFCKRSPEVSGIFRAISDTNAKSALYLTAKLYEIFYYLESDSPDVPKKYRRLFPALIEIEKKYAENHPVSYYAKKCGMSRSNFEKLFREHTKKSFIEYRNEIRIFRAVKMVESGEFSVSEAAYLSGFNNMSFFYEVYRRYSDIKPLQNKKIPVSRSKR